MKQGTALFKSGYIRKKDVEEDAEELKLPDVSDVVNKSKRILSENQIKVCRVCGSETCSVATRIPKDEYIEGKYID